MATAPIIKIAAPEILLIHQSCFSLNLDLKISTKEVRVYHQRIAPIKTPLVATNESTRFVPSATTPSDAKRAINRKTARGLVMVTSKTER